MSDPTLNSVKSDAQERADALAETARLERKTMLLTALVNDEARLVKYVDCVKERRAALKANKKTAEDLLASIASRADDQDLEIEELERLLETITQFRASIPGAQTEERKAPSFAPPSFAPPMTP